MNALKRTAASVICDLEALIREFRTLPPGAGAGRCRALVETLGRPREIMPLLEGILKDERLLADISGRSYSHVNKFDKIVLVDSPEQDGYRLTLHLWRPPYAESDRGEEMIHGHRFSFWSAIVAGTLSSELFEEREGGRALCKYRYIPDARRAAEFRDFYQFEASVSLARVGTEEKLSGDSYHLDSVAIHRIILPRRATTCTLVLRGPRLSEYSHVYNAGYPSTDVYLRNKMFSPHELEARLRRLLSALKEDPGSAPLAGT